MTRKLVQNYQVEKSENQKYEFFTKRGGENMNWLIKLAQYKVLVVLVATLALGFFVLPNVATGTVGDNCSSDTDCDSGEKCVGSACASITTGDSSAFFGLGYAEETGLGSRDIRATIASIINVALGLLGIVAVVIVLVGGFKWMTAGGNDEKVTEARKLIFAGIIGLAIILSAYAIAKFVLSQLYSATEAGVVTTD